MGVVWRHPKIKEQTQQSIRICFNSRQQWLLVLLGRELVKLKMVEILFCGREEIYSVRKVTRIVIIIRLLWELIRMDPKMGKMLIREQRVIWCKGRAWPWWTICFHQKTQQAAITTDLLNRLIVPRKDLNHRCQNVALQNSLPTKHHTIFHNFKSCPKDPLK